MTQVPDARIRQVNSRPERPDGDYVLYWMIAHRRTRHHFGLQRAVERANALGVSLVVLEPLRVDYRWSSARLHRFVIDGMADNAKRCADAGVRYHAYVEPKVGAGRGLLQAIARRAALVVTDEFPCFFLPAMVAAAGAGLDVRLEAVDGNGLLPLAEADRFFTTAYSFRRFLQKSLRPHLEAFPVADPLADLQAPAIEIDAEIDQRWPAPPPEVLSGEDRTWLEALPLCEDVAPAAERGGSTAGEAAIEEFVERRLARYADDRNQPQQEVASGLSPYLHFGHVSAHEVVERVLGAEGWTPDLLGDRTDGKRSGWWGASAPAEAFLDELITWRELGYVFSSRRPDDYHRFESLPDWALATLAKHGDDPREHAYDLATFDAAETHDPLWNAAQEQLRREGRIHNYLRMLWGKKILEWSGTPQDALATMIELNNRYALDGRNPNSYSGIFWVLGRFDRAWGPERPVFGTVRFMSSANTARKVKVRDYVRHWTGAAL